VQLVALTVPQMAVGLVNVAEIGGFSHDFPGRRCTSLKNSHGQTAQPILMAFWISKVEEPSFLLVWTAALDVFESVSVFSS